MDIALQGDGYIGVAQDFAEGFDVKAAFDAAGGKGVAKKVKGVGGESGLGQDLMIISSNDAWV